MDDIFFLSGKNKCNSFISDIIKFCYDAFNCMFPYISCFVLFCEPFYLSFTIEHSIFVIFLNIPSIQCLYHSLLCQLLLSCVSPSVFSCPFLAFIFFGLSIFFCCLLREFFKLFFQIYEFVLHDSLSLFQC